eukprot:7709259-Alexandrium_andersonii.AAC.1
MPRPAVQRRGLRQAERANTCGMSFCGPREQIVAIPTAAFSGRYSVRSVRSPPWSVPSIDSVRSIPRC